jgi:tryptophan synthase alpha chain
MSPIDAVFAQCRSHQKMAFIPFVTAGDPDLATTQAVIRDLSSAGADLIEVGFPYSDPIADGPVIQASYTRALQRHIKLQDIFAAVGALKGQVSTPLLAMVSYAIIFRHGTARFIEHAVQAGFAGLIVPDLPGDEAEEFAALVRPSGLALVQLVAPTTPRERLSRILEHGSGFVYCIAVAGTTGVREAIPSDLAGMLKSLRSQTSLPLAVGFGLSRPEQIQQLKGLADGAIVGSALVRLLEPGPGETIDACRDRLKAAAVQLAAAAHSPG